MKFGVMFDFSDPTQWRRPDPALYRSHLDEIVRLEELGYHNVWLTDHHFVEDGYRERGRKHRDLCPSAALSQSGAGGGGRDLH